MPAARPAIGAVIFADIDLAPEELEKLTALVQESIGFNKERGD